MAGRSVSSASRSYKRTGYALFVIQSSYLYEVQTFHSCVCHVVFAGAEQLAGDAIKSDMASSTNVIFLPFQKVPVFVCQIRRSFPYEHAD